MCCLYVEALLWLELEEEATLWLDPATVALEATALLAEAVAAEGTAATEVEEPEAVAPTLGGGCVTGGATWAVSAGVLSG